MWVDYGRKLINGHSNNLDPVFDQSSKITIVSRKHCVDDMYD